MIMTILGVAAAREALETAATAPSMEVDTNTPDDELDAFLFGEYDDLTEEQQRIVDAGNEIAGQFPEGLSKEELSACIKERLL
jgi:hypothetical protein